MKTRFHFYASVSFEEWDHRSPDDPGIGGSETAVAELAKRLASRGHPVTVYTKVREGCPEYDAGGARWLPLEAADFTASGVWVLSRCPSALDNFALPHPRQKIWLVCQDVYYPKTFADGHPVANGMSEQRVEKLDWAFPLCHAHEKLLVERVPELKGKTRLSSNGIRSDLVAKVEASVLPPRDPYKIMFTSSPDRGLASLLRIYARARETEPRLSLVAAYGWDNIEKCEGKHWKRVREECESLASVSGVTYSGRLPQPELYRLFLTSGLWVYPTTFTETSCVSCMEAQALGAIPITNPLWALADNVRHGVFLPGDPANDPLVRAQYVGEILRLTGDIDLQERIRAEMMPWARAKFDWERVVNDYEAWAGELS
jgi:protein O-GlcNAc transferase